MLWEVLVTYRQFLHYDLGDDKELSSLAVSDKPAGNGISFRYDPRDITCIFRRDSDGRIRTYSLSVKRENMKSYRYWTWDFFDEFYRQYLKRTKELKQVNSTDRILLGDELNSIFRMASSLAEGPAVDKNIKEYSSTERTAFRVSDNRKRNAIFGSGNSEAIDTGTAPSLMIEDHTNDSLAARNDARIDAIDMNAPEHLEEIIKGYGIREG